MKRSNKGFTLAELLIVIAIIAVLVAIAIPIFSTQLEKARESTDASNIRAAYAELMTAVLTEDEDVESTSKAYEVEYADGVYTATIGLVQKVADWQNKNIENIGGVDVSSIAPAAEGTWTITYTVETDTLEMSCAS